MVNWSLMLRRVINCRIFVIIIIIIIIIIIRPIIIIGVEPECG